MTKLPFQRSAFAQNLVARGLIGLALALPYRLRVPLMGWVLRRIIGPVAGYSKRACENLALIWPDMPQEDRSKIAMQSLDNAGRTLIEN